MAKFLRSAAVIALFLASSASLGLAEQGIVRGTAEDPPEVVRCGHLAAYDGRNPAAIASDCCRRTLEGEAELRACFRFLTSGDAATYEEANKVFAQCRGQAVPPPSLRMPLA